MTEQAAPATAANTKPPEPAVAPPEAAKPDPRIEELETQVKAAARKAMEVAKREKAVAEKDAAMAKEREEYAAWKREKELAKLNPEKFIAGFMGEDFYDRLTERKLNGGAPAADVIAAEFESREEKLKREWTEKLEAQKKELEDFKGTLSKQEAQRQKAEYEAGVLSHIAASKDKYPLIAEFKEEKAVLRLIEEEWNRTAKQEEDGSWNGTLLTAEQASALIEKHLEDFGARYQKVKAPPPAPKPNASPAVKRTDSTQRTEQPNPAPQPARVSEKERMKRAVAALVAARKP